MQHEVVFYLFLNINQLDALNFIISLFQALTCFEHMCSSSGRQKLYYTASGIITPIGGRPVHRLRESSLNLCTGRELLLSFFFFSCKARRRSECLLSFGAEPSVFQFAIQKFKD